MGSAPQEMNWEDVYKAMKAFAWNFITLTTAISGYLVTVPQSSLPSWLVGVWIAAPTLNGIGVLIMKWWMDNREYR